MNRRLTSTLIRCPRCARGALFLLPVILVAFGCDSLFDNSVREEQRVVTDEVTRLVVEADAGDVVVTTAETDVVTIDLVIHGEETELDQSLSGGVLTLETDCDHQTWNCSIDFMITAPPQMDVVLNSGSGDVAVIGTDGDARIETGSGNAEAHCIRGEEVQLVTGSGDIFTTSLDVGQVTADTGSGDVHGSELAVARIDAETGSGDIELAFDIAPDAIDARTGSGDIELDLPADQYRLITDTGSGDVDIDGVTPSSDSTRSIVARTGSGDITVTGR